MSSSVVFWIVNIIGLMTLCYAVDDPRELKPLKKDVEKATEQLSTSRRKFFELKKEFLQSEIRIVKQIDEKLDRELKRITDELRLVKEESKRLCLVSVRANLSETRNHLVDELNNCKNNEAFHKLNALTIPEATKLIESAPEVGNTVSVKCTKLRGEEYEVCMRGFVPQHKDRMIRMRNDINNMKNQLESEIRAVHPQDIGKCQDGILHNFSEKARDAQMESRKCLSKLFS